jgi:pantoate--beta-alanine ligase
MELIKSLSEMKGWSRDINEKKKTIGFVPTMGYLHDGHLSLVKKAREQADKVLVSIFVNPTQFGPDEDFDSYPMDLDRDLDLLRTLSVDAVFFPRKDQLYPEGYQTFVEVRSLTKGLCGRDRPIHFEGVATIVTKLFNIIRPHFAVFGEKDFQQLAVIKRLVRDLNLDVEVISAPIFREEDGLAMSSRNVHLGLKERECATILFRSLELARDMVRNGCASADEIKASVTRKIEMEKFTEIDYVSLVDPDTLEEVNIVQKPTLLVMAVKVGKPRLLDNTILVPR